MPHDARFDGFCRWFFVVVFSCRGKFALAGVSPPDNEASHSEGMITQVSTVKRVSE